MLAIKLILEGLGLGALLYLVCAAGIRNGAIGMVHLHDRKVQDRVVQLGITGIAASAITKSGKRTKSTMGGSAALCAVFAGLLFRGYKIKEKNER